MSNFVASDICIKCSFVRSVYKAIIILPLIELPLFCCCVTEVKPYIVNDRLFTEPLKNTFLPGEDIDSPEDRKTAKKPTQENPRFVRYKHCLFIVRRQVPRDFIEDI